MIIQWRALRGIRRLVKRREEIDFIFDPLLNEWEKAVAGDDPERCVSASAAIAAKHKIENLEKILRLKPAGLAEKESAVFDRSG